MLISQAYAQTASGAATGGLQGTLVSMVPLLLMFAVLYFIMIRPQMKKAKEHRALIDALAKGDEVVTSGGIFGKVTQLQESIIGLEVAASVEVKIQRGAVARVLPKGTLK